MSQSLSQVYIHIIYHTHCRKVKIPTDLLQELHQLCAGLCNDHNCPSIAVGGVEDHIHILCKLNRILAISKVVQDIKATSSLWIRDQYLRFPKLSKFNWQRGYGVFSVSQSQVGRVEAYILNQREHHKKVPFKEEYIKFLEMHQIKYDEKYLWSD